MCVCVRERERERERGTDDNDDTPATDHARFYDVLFLASFVTVNAAINFTAFSLSPRARKKSHTRDKNFINQRKKTCVVECSALSATNQPGRLYFCPSRFLNVSALWFSTFLT